VSVPLNANELLLTAQGAELQQLVSWKFLWKKLLCSNRSQTKMERLKKWQQ